MSAPPPPPIKALFFDVFGTCVDWRKTVTETLYQSGQAASGTPAAEWTRDQWAALAQEWRNSYLAFTRRVASAPTATPYLTVDEHHRASLETLLQTHGLGTAFSAAQMDALALVWHRLEPWPDAAAGLAALNADARETCTLSNGNVALLRDLCKHGALPFGHVLSAEMFRSYKPDPAVYLGAVAKLGLEPGECAMVAAHLEDLRAARKNGMQTVYVERPQEERHPELASEGFVDVWVAEGEGGFVTVAERLRARDQER